MDNGNFGAGIFGFILGVLTLGLFAIFKRKKDERSNNPGYEVHDSEYDSFIRNSK